MSVNLNTEYRVGSGNLSLTVVIGDAQFGTSILKLDGENIQLGIIDNVSLGTGSDLIGKVLTIKTIVSDVNDATNHTSVTYSFREGTNEQKYGLEAVVGEEGGSVMYRAAFRFLS